MKKYDHILLIALIVVTIINAVMDFHRGPTRADIFSLCCSVIIIFSWGYALLKEKK